MLKIVRSLRSESANVTDSKVEEHVSQKSTHSTNAPNAESELDPDIT